jgi:predicted RNA-binding protein with PUA-like domain
MNAMAYWLLKTEPEEFSWDDLARKGSEPWTGVRNFQARSHLKNMKEGDRAFFYHTGDQKQVVGIAEVTRTHYPDPTAAPGEPWVVVDVKPVAPVPRPVTLKEIKGEKALGDMVLVKAARLSVQPVTAEQWKMVCRMGGVKG